MKKILSSTVAFALLCGTAGAIGIEWGVDNLYLPGTPDALATDSTYGTDVGKYVLQLVWVGENSTYFQNGKLLDGYTVAGSADLATQPAVVPGSVSGSTETTTAGTYMMFLYNNYGGYYSLSGTIPDPLVITSTMLAEPYKFEGTSFQATSGDVYRGALVPEPGTTALALAGVALLFRRRKA